MGSNSSTTNQSQSSQFSPWGPTIPGLTNIVNQISGMFNGVTPGQSQAQATLGQEANTLPSFGNQATTAINQLFGSNTTPNQGLWGNAENLAQGVWSPYLSAAYTNPMTTPGLSTALQTQQQDITNQINGQFASAGRSDSPANTQALARGLAQGTAPTIASEFNTLTGNQLGANNAALSGAGSTAAGTAQLQQLPYQNFLQAIGASAGVPGLWMAPGQAQVGASNQNYLLPFQNIQAPETMLAAAAGLGGTSSGEGTSTTSQPMNPLTTGLGAGLGLMGMKSDVRVKEHIKPVGKTFEGLPLYSYAYKADPEHRRHIGVMAQDVEQFDPGAVREEPFTGVKVVDYSRLGLWAAA